MKNDVKRAELKADAMLHYGKEKDRLLAPFEQKAATLEAQLQDRVEEVAQLNEQLAAAQTDAGEKGDELAVFGGTIEEQHALIQDRQAAVEALQGQLNTMQTELEETNAKNLLQVEELASLKEIIADRENEAGAIATVVAEATDKKIIELFELA